MDFVQLQLIGQNGHYRRKQLCFTIGLVPRKPNRLGLRTRNSDPNAVKPIRWHASEDPLWPEC